MFFLAVLELAVPLSALPDNVSGTVVFPFICNGKGFSPVKKKDPHVTKRDPEIITVFRS